MTLFRGNPEFPDEDPVLILPGASTNDTDVFYCIDPDGVSVLLGNVRQEDGSTNSSLAGQTILTPKYGKFVKIVNASAVNLWAYRVIPGSEDS